MTLISTQEAAALLDRKDVVFMHVTVFVPGLSPDGQDAYAAKRIPRARLFDLDALGPEDQKKPHRKPEPDDLRSHLGNLGVSAKDHIIAYDPWGLLSAARLWWMLCELGHKRVSVLDGGLPKWESEGLPLERETVSRLPIAYPNVYESSPDKQLKNQWADFETVKSLSRSMSLKTSTDMLIDARGRDRFKGEVPDLWPNRRSGHIPGAVNLPFTALLNAETKTMKPIKELQTQFENLGLMSEQNVVCSCGSGVTACIVALGLSLIGHQGDVRVYDGSWAEWGHQDSKTEIVQSKT